MYTINNVSIRGISKETRLEMLHCKTAYTSIITLLIIQDVKLITFYLQRELNIHSDYSYSF